MSSVTQTQYTDEQISVWLRGLLTVAWADGHYDPEEKDFIASLTHEELAPQTDLGSLEPISAHELAQTMKGDPEMAENFMRTAVMMALANGVYSKEESNVINEFLDALDLEVEELKALEHTLYDPDKHNIEPEADDAFTSEVQADQQATDSHLSLPHPHVLKPIQKWLDKMDVNDPRVARFICKSIPPQCPFERDIKLFGHKVVHIPPMCKLNPLYEQLVGLRFRALSFLADECGEDVSKYC
ncbi:Mo-dependent nitrogenase C-terminal domain-containing protein [Spirulina sp. CS-785/01]|uniref:Mo-dependent nitrogenase C-terminal domain-containing protein n=1 Tax=Spirulina sp. CS-785/01 TaxID=3021716 RepID=UPI00232C1BB4|nr:Mo-dependent nitrogenase C-terminal domain-containing protein [Spirulina sp. CS-785/01]MDB9313889.1 Mo-dependent nitrogenase C-terminal domain-containing protein [Spirulina sp. CS-785/01]